MEEIATYYATLKAIKDGGLIPNGMSKIAYVDEPAIEEVGIYLKKHDTRTIPSSEEEDAIIQHLSNCGIVKPDNWTEVSEDEYLQAKKTHLTTDPTSRESFNDVQKSGGGGQWLVRYEYDGPSDSKNRTFCARIIGLGRLYTEEEIKNGLSNPRFGSYSIFDYKGSYGCRHVWKRKIFFEDYDDEEVRRVGFVPTVVSRLDDRDATTLNAFLSKNEKMQVVAPLLIPDKDIYRNDELGRYNMRFSQDTVKELYNVALSNKLFETKDLFKDTHKGGVAPSYVLDHWIIENENDKAYTEYKFNASRVPVGSLMVQSQVTDKVYWEQDIKIKKKHSYSIEALINLTIVEMSSQKPKQYGDVVVFNDKDQFLILQRKNSDNYMPNKICLPGGKIEKGEEIKDGAIRELIEETGLQIEDAIFLESIENKDGSSSHYYTAKSSDTVRLSDEHKTFSWVTNLDAIPKEMFIEADKERIVQIVKKSNINQKKVNMENDQIVLPDGEHLIDGKVYIVKGGVVVEVKDVTDGQEKLIEDNLEKSAEENLKEEEKPKEELAEDKPKEEEKLAEEKPKEELAEEKPKEEKTPEKMMKDGEEKPKEEMAEEAPTAEPTSEIANLQKQIEDLVAMVAELKTQIESKPTEEVPVEMTSQKQPLYKSVMNLINNK